MSGVRVPQHPPLQKFGPARIMKEYEIRPEHLLDRYLELSRQDAARYFAGLPREPVPCVACGSRASMHQFEKNGFGYVTCTACGSLFQSPRPPASAFEVFYRD